MAEPAGLAEPTGLAEAAGLAVGPGLAEAAGFAETAGLAEAERSGVLAALPSGDGLALATAFVPLAGVRTTAARWGFDVARTDGVVPGLPAVVAATAGAAGGGVSAEWSVAVALEFMSCSHLSYKRFI